MSTINNLLIESTVSGSSEQGRPTLVGLTKATNKIILDKLVAIQPTKMPVSALFGLKYLTPDGEFFFNTSASYSGKYGSRDGIPLATLETPIDAQSFVVSDKHVIYQAVITCTLSSYGQDLATALGNAVIQGALRFVSDAAPTSHFEDQNTTIAECNFQIDKWQVPVATRKLKTVFTIELFQDMEANQLNPNGVINDALAAFMAEEINKDIIQKLITVSKRYKVQGHTDNAILDLSGKGDAPVAGRTLYRYVEEMSRQMVRETSFCATYVLGTPRAIGILSASGWMRPNPLDSRSAGVLMNGLEVFIDNNTSFEYVIVGCKHSDENLDKVGSLFLSPYTEADGAGAFRVAINPDSLQPAVMLMCRYGLSVNPYTTEANDGEARIIQGDDWVSLVGQSKMSYLLGLALPEFVK